MVDCINKKKKKPLLQNGRLLHTRIVMKDRKLIEAIFRFPNWNLYNHLPKVIELQLVKRLDKSFETIWHTILTYTDHTFRNKNTLTIVRNRNFFFLSIIRWSQFSSFSAYAVNIA